MKVVYTNFNSAGEFITYDYFWLSLKSYIEDNSDHIIDWSHPFIDTDYESFDDLVDSISPYFMRVRKSDLGLPPVVDNSPIYVEMDPEQTRGLGLLERGNRFARIIQQPHPDALPVHLVLQPEVPLHL